MISDDAVGAPSSYNQPVEWGNDNAGFGPIRPDRAETAAIARDLLPDTAPATRLADRLQIESGTLFASARSLTGSLDLW